MIRVGQNIAIRQNATAFIRRGFNIDNLTIFACQHMVESNGAGGLGDSPDLVRDIFLQQDFVGDYIIWHADNRFGAEKNVDKLTNAVFIDANLA